MMLKIKIIIFILFLSLLNVTYGRDQEDRSFGYTLNNFGFDLFKQINIEKDESFLISPISIFTALMMFNGGASGSTSENILSTLNIALNAKPRSATINDIYHHMMSYFYNHDNLYINNSIWIQKDECYMPNNSYISFVDSVFSANAFYVDFSKNTFKIIQNINDWVANATNGLIENMVSDNDIKKTTVQALLNTVYFKQSWSTPFNVEMTKLDFFNTNDHQEEIYMMNKEGLYAYYDNEKFQLLELGHIEKGPNPNVIDYNQLPDQISTLFFLPKDGVDLDSLINDLDALVIEDSIDSLKLSKGNISIPKFKLESSTSLKQYLQAMGMTIPFSPYLASFDGFWDYGANWFKSPPNHYIDVINHKTNINLDENGLEVAAATSVIINRITSIPSLSKPFSFIANKPFLYVIYEADSSPTGGHQERIWESHENSYKRRYGKIIFIGKYTGQ